MIAAACAAAAVVVLAGGLVRRGPRLAAPIRRRPRGDPPGDLIGLLELASQELRTGSSLGQALRRATVAHPGALAPSAPRATRRPADLDTDRAVAEQAIAAASALGGQPAAALDGAAAVLRERRALRAERAAHSAQARLSAMVLTAVPLVFAGWAALTDGSTRQAYTHSPLGAAAVAIGLSLNAAGWWWMRRIVGRPG